MSRELSSWSTENEMAFIKGLSESRRAIELLRGYLEGFSKRSDFGQINANEVMFCAKMHLAMLTNTLKV